MDLNDAEPELDLRGEICPGPSLAVARYLREHPDGVPFVVLGDHGPLFESLGDLAAEHGLVAEFERAPDGLLRVRFVRGA